MTATTEESVSDMLVTDIDSLPTEDAFYTLTYYYTETVSSSTEGTGFMPRVNALYDVLVILIPTLLGSFLVFLAVVCALWWSSRRKKELTLDHIPLTDVRVSQSYVNEGLSDEEDSDQNRATGSQELSDGPQSAPSATPNNEEPLPKGTKFNTKPSKRPTSKVFAPAVAYEDVDMVDSVGRRRSNPKATWGERYPTVADSANISHDVTMESFGKGKKTSGYKAGSKKRGIVAPVDPDDRGIKSKRPLSLPPPPPTEDVLTTDNPYEDVDHRFERARTIPLPPALKPDQSKDRDSHVYEGVQEEIVAEANKVEPRKDLKPTSVRGYAASVSTEGSEESGHPVTESSASKDASTTVAGNDNVPVYAEVQNRGNTKTDDNHAPRTGDGPPAYTTVEKEGRSARQTDFGLPEGKGDPHATSDLDDGSSVTDANRGIHEYEDPSALDAEDSPAPVDVKVQKGGGMQGRTDTHVPQAGERTPPTYATVHKKGTSQGRTKSKFPKGEHGPPTSSGLNGGSPLNTENTQGGHMSASVADSSPAPVYAEVQKKGRMQKKEDDTPASGAGDQTQTYASVHKEGTSKLGKTSSNFQDDSGLQFSQSEHVYESYDPGDSADSRRPRSLANDLDLPDPDYDPYQYDGQESTHV